VALLAEVVVNRPREAAVERALVRRLRAELGLVALKLERASGWPDRLVLLSGGRCLFLEVKRPGGQTRKLQTLVHGDLRRLGHSVHVVDDVETTLRLVARALRDT
jgi:hypothetical protein